MKKGSVVTCEVTEVKEAGLDVKIVDTDLATFIKRADLARDRAEQRPERFAVGQKVDARVTQFDRKTHKVARLHQGAGSRRGEGSDGAVRLGRIRARRSATSSAPRSSSAPARTRRED